MEGTTSGVWHTYYVLILLYHAPTKEKTFALGVPSFVKLSREVLWCWIRIYVGQAYWITTL